MTKHEKVIKGLECLARKREPTANPCRECGYIDRANFAICVQDIASDTLALLKEQEPIRCKDCKFFEIKDYWVDYHGVPILGASDQPTCTRWGEGDCKTSPEGYCFLAEKR